jgi:DnaJ-class molecular chaperone
MKDPYKTLGVSRDASAADIKRAYRQLAKKLHPDLNPGNDKIEQQFKDVSQAHSILGNAKKRKQFDQGAIDASGQQTGWQGGFYKEQAGHARANKYRPFEFGQDINVEDILSDLFGGRGARGTGKGGARTGRRAKPRGADVSYTAPIDFLDAAVGAKKRIRLSDGKVLNMTIPPGTSDRQTLRLRGQGVKPPGGGSPGDAYVEVHISPHAYFTRKDDNIHLELPITLQEAVLGATVDVPTVHGKVSMKIPPGSNTGTTLRLKGKGVVNRKTGNKGDQYVRLKITLPEKPDTELKDFVERWSAKHGYDPRRKAGME